MISTENILIPSAEGDVPVTLSGGLATTSHGVSARARTHQAAVLKLGREVFKARQLFGLVGRARLLAMKDCADRLDGFRLAGSVPLSWRVRARALGCQVPAKAGPDGWAGELAALTRLVAQLVERTLAAGPLGRPGVRYPLILADPPWSFSDKGTRLAPEYEGDQRRWAAYPTMPLPEIEALGEYVRPAAADDAILLLWVPASLVAACFHARVAEAWGFTCKTLFPWIKTTNDREAIRMGGGHYARAVHEELCVAVRGEVDARAEDQRLVVCSRGSGSAVVQSHSVKAIICAPRGGHSAKPDAQYDLIDALVGKDVPKLELFARMERDGYDAWGNEVPA